MHDLGYISLLLPSHDLLPLIGLLTGPPDQEGQGALAFLVSGGLGEPRELAARDPVPQRGRHQTGRHGAAQGRGDEGLAAVVVGPGAV